MPQTAQTGPAVGPPPGTPYGGAPRADDRLTEAAMEDRKKEGYF